MQGELNELREAISRSQWSEVEKIAAVILAQRPESPDVLALRGQALRKLSREREALESFEQATRERPIFPEAWQQREELLTCLADPRPRYRVTVITPTVGSEFLEQAIQSVQSQNYPFIEHYIVVDGPESLDRVQKVLPIHPTKPVYLCTLPLNVGSGGYCGHRVYGAFPSLVRGEYLAFLDEDNYFDSGHIASLMEPITRDGLSWAYALRRLVDSRGGVVADDDCESLGEWAAWNNPKTHLVDTNCYLVRRDIAIQVGVVWFRRFRDQVNPDFVFCAELMKRFPRYKTNGLSTVNYRLGSTAESVSREFFLAGNKEMRKRYGDNLPWRATI
jgi:hypothetical protein